METCRGPPRCIQTVHAEAVRSTRAVHMQTVAPCISPPSCESCAFSQSGSVARAARARVRVPVGVARFVHRTSWGYVHRSLVTVVSRLVSRRGLAGRQSSRQ